MGVKVYMTNGKMVDVKKGVSHDRTGAMVMVYDGSTPPKTVFSAELSQVAYCVDSDDALEDRDDVGDMAEPE